MAGKPAGKPAGSQKKMKVKMTGKMKEKQEKRPKKGVERRGVDFFFFKPRAGSASNGCTAKNHADCTS